MIGFRIRDKRDVRGVYCGNVSFPYVDELCPQVWIYQSPRTVLATRDPAAAARLQQRLEGKHVTIFPRCPT